MRMNASIVLKAEQCSTATFPLEWAQIDGVHRAALPEKVWIGMWMKNVSVAWN